MSWGIFKDGERRLSEDEWKGCYLDIYLEGVPGQSAEYGHVHHAVCRVQLAQETPHGHQTTLAGQLQDLTTGLGVDEKPGQI